MDLYCMLTFFKKSKLFENVFNAIVESIVSQVFYRLENPGGRVFKYHYWIIATLPHLPPTGCVRGYT